MYLQRMIIDHRGEMNYDYMGSSEFEFGGTRRAREALSRMVIDKQLTGKKIRLFEKWGRATYGPTEVFVFGSKDAIDELGRNASTKEGLDDLVVTPEKEAARIDDSRYIGWLRIDPWKRGYDPLLIIRATDEIIKLGNQFLQHFIDQILAEEAKVN